MKRYIFKSSHDQNLMIEELLNGRTRAFFGSIAVGDFDTLRDAFIALMLMADGVE